MCGMVGDTIDLNEEMVEESTFPAGSDPEVSSRQGCVNTMQSAGVCERINVYLHTVVTNFGRVGLSTRVEMLMHLLVASFFMSLGCMYGVCE